MAGPSARAAPGGAGTSASTAAAMQAPASLTGAMSSRSGIASSNGHMTAPSSNTGTLRTAAAAPWTSHRPICMHASHALTCAQHLPPVALGQAASSRMQPRGAHVVCERNQAHERMWRKHFEGC
jgi:hypothetical protein